MNPFLTGFVDELVKTGASRTVPRHRPKLELPKPKKPKHGSYFELPEFKPPKKPQKIKT